MIVDPRFAPHNTHREDPSRFATFVAGERFQPVEVKWTAQVRSADLKQARRYPNSIVCSKLATARVHGLPNELLPLHLQRLGPSPHYVTW